MIQTYEFEVCWRDRCWTGRHFERSTPAQGETFPHVSSGPAFPENWPVASVFIRESAGTFTLFVSWTPHHPTNFEYANGDAFRYAVRDENGATILARSGTVHWEILSLTPQCPTSMLMCPRAVVQ